MTKNQSRFGQGRTVPTLAVLLTLTLLVTACGAASALSGAISTPAAPAAAAPAAKPGANATPIALASVPVSGINCAATFKANQDFGMSLAPLVNLTANTDYAGLTDPASIVYVDFAKLRGDLSTLALLPDPTNAVELTFGKPSESAAYFGQMLDIAEADVKAKGKPFNDTSSTGQKVIGLDSPWMKEMGAFSLAMDKACKNFTPPADTPASSQATNQIGQAAMLGDLQVTLDKVISVPGQLGDLANAGNRFVFVYITIVNTGKASLVTNSVTNATFQDAAGQPYYFDANTIGLSDNHEVNGQVAAGATTTGTIGYELPTNAGDVVWIVVDNAGHRAVFAVPASSIVVEGTPISASANADMETSVAATTSALIEMGNSMDATAAAMTANPGTPQPADTDIPTDTPAPTDIPAPTDTPSP